MDYYKISKETIGLIYQSYKTLKSSPLDQTLKILAEVYVSQINGCAYCVKVHTLEAKEHGIPQEKLDSLPQWRTKDQFSEVEQAVLDWCEMVTYVNHDADYSKLSDHFTDREIVDLTTSIALINALNRLSIFLKSE